MNITTYLTIILKIKMKNRILQCVGKQDRQHHFITTQQPILYIIDWKQTNGGNIQLHNQPQTYKNRLIHGIAINNPIPLEIISDLLDDNALPIAKGRYSQQCESILFPSSNQQTDWLLLIELKYVDPNKPILKDHINKALSQLINTAHFLKTNSIIPSNKTIYGTITFPTQELESYRGWIMTIFDATKYLDDYGILIGITDTVDIIGPTSLLIK